MNLFQMVQAVQSGQGSQLQQNPLFQQANQMMQGKSPDQINQLITNLAKERGVSPEEISKMTTQLQQMGIK